jgi:hypothetical protein
MFPTDSNNGFALSYFWSHSFINSPIVGFPCDMYGNTFLKAWDAGLFTLSVQENIIHPPVILLCGTMLE